MCWHHRKTMARGGSGSEKRGRGPLVHIRSHGENSPCWNWKILQMPTVVEVPWLCVLDSKWPGPVMAGCAPRDYRWWLGLLLLSKEVCCRPPSESPPPWKAWHLGQISDSLMTWKIMPLPDSQWVAVFNSKYSPSISLALEFSSEVMRTGGEPMAMAIQEANSGFQ